MKDLFKLFVLLFVLLACFSLNAQMLKENEIVVIKGEKFILHQVRTGETIYSITRKYKTDSLTLSKHNERFSEGLKIGDILKIPYRSDVQTADDQVFLKGDPTRFDFHTITSKKETPYFIAKSYGITVEELYAYNPEVKKFRRGIKLRIPRWDVNAQIVKNEQTKTTPDGDDKLIEHEVVPGETLYSLSKKYNVSESEILFYNPDARNLMAGSKIYFPRKTNVPNQVVPENVAETRYFEHVIESGETMWGITHRYGVSEMELKALNPPLESGFPAGLTIKIPVQEISKTEVKPVNNDAFLSHFVEKGETLFGLSVKYELPITEIKKYNPSLSNRNLVFGETILIPQKTRQEVLQVVGITKEDSIRFSNNYYKLEVKTQVPESCQPEFEGFRTNKIYDVALFLPLYLEANDTLYMAKDTTILIDSIPTLKTDSLLMNDPIFSEKYEFYKNSEMYMQFYEGILLAADSLAKTGAGINLQVFDTENDIEKLREQIYSDNFQEFDLIIGPINENLQAEVAQIAAKNQIPIVSPISPVSKEVQTNPHYFQVNPDRNILADKTAEMVAEEFYNSNFVVCQTGNYKGTYEEKLLDKIQEKIFISGALSDLNGVSYRFYDFAAEGPFGLRRILSATKENVIFIPSSNEGELSVAISNIFNLSDEFSITLITSDYRFQQIYQSIEVEHFHKLKLQYVDPFWVDYSTPSTIQFIENFRNNFYTEPNNFGFQGYDVGMYFFSALKNFGKNFYDCLPYNPVHLIQGNYSFTKISEWGGYVNTGVSVISYQPDFDVVRKRINNNSAVIAKKTYSLNGQ